LPLTSSTLLVLDCFTQSPKEITMKLYYHPLSGHSHRVRLFFSLLGIEPELVLVDLMKGEHKGPEFLKLNSFGQVPVLVDGDKVITDSNAILVYLARHQQRIDWLPEDPAEAAAVQRWLSVASGEIAGGPASARLITLFGAKLNPEDTIRKAHAILKLVDGELAMRDWLAASNPTIADVAMYSYIDRAPEGNVDLSGYPHIQSWLARMRSLPGFLEFNASPVGMLA
jgi:glutathione S-transferase